LKAVYPAIYRLVGCDFFDALASKFIGAHPPNQGALIAYGTEFPAFLDTFEPAQQLPYLADMARLEWARHEAFHAADAIPLNGSTLAELTSEQIAGLRFRLSPSAGLLASPYPLATLWELTHAEEEPEETVEIQPTASHLLIHRPDMDVQILTLSESAFIFLKSLSDGQNLTEAYEATIKQNPGFNLQATLKDLMDTEAFTAIETEQQRTDEKNDRARPSD